MSAAQTIVDKDSMTARFLRDIARHEMTIVRDDGVARHVRFAIPDSSDMHFDLITWPGYLCYTGDMGTYVFQRDRDMFEFFRRGSRGQPYQIDFGYWASKVEAADAAGIRQFRHEKFQALVRSWVDDSANDDRPGEDDAAAAALHAAAYAELRAAVEDEVASTDDNAVRCYDAANEFSHNGDAWQAFHGKDAAFEFSAVWEGFDHATEAYTFHFLWCCHALAWGIDVYDQAKLASAVDTRTLDLFTGAAEVGEPS